MESKKMTKRGLGRGLDLLIPAGDEKPQGYQEVPLVAISPNPYQPRHSFPDPDLDELAASIQEHGILQPLIVTQQHDGTYRLIAGERRLRAAQKAGLDTVPVMIKDAAPQEMLEMALVENLQRADLNPLEQALAYQHLAEVYQLSKSEIAQRVGKSRVAVVNVMRLLDAAPAIQKMLLEGIITEGHGRALLGLPEHERQEAALKVTVEQGLTVRETEALVRRWRLADEGEFADEVRMALLQGTLSENHGQVLAHLAVPHQTHVLHLIISKHLSVEETEALVDALKYRDLQETPEKRNTDPNPEIKAIEQRFEQALGTRVRLRDGNKGGHLVIYYYSDEEFQTLYERLVGEKL
jgi:ParB family chromosome partitioning protein